MWRAAAFIRGHWWQVNPDAGHASSITQTQKYAALFGLPGLMRLE
jgi:hypothetical protein